MKEYFRNDVCSLLLWHLQRAGGYAAKRVNSSFEDGYRKNLKFDRISDWKKFRACIDLFEDSEYAIISGYMYQLGDLENQNRDFGEKYVRLYGILNAVYLQISSIIGLARLLKYPNPKELERKFKKLSIYQLRNIAGSHTVNFELSGEILEEKGISSRLTSFRIVHIKLTKSGENIVAVDENDITIEFNLLGVLEEYNTFSFEYLIKIIDYSIDSLVLKKIDKERMKERLTELINGQVEYNTLNKNIGYRERVIKKEGVI